MSNLDKLRELTAVLQSMEHNIQDVIDFLPLCIHTIGLNKSIATMNPAGLDMIGAKLEDVVGTNYFSFAQDHEHKKMEEYWDAAINRGVTTKFDFDGVNGRRFSSCFSPIIVNGKVKKVVGFTLDVTDRNKD